MNHDAILIVGFGGPERPEDVLPFLENVTRGRNVPRDRLLEVAKHYDHFGGASPINQQVRDLIAAIRPELGARGISLPIYWGNRNWHPMLAATMREMAEEGIRRALAVPLAAYGSYSSCRQYLENIERARQAVGDRAPQVDKVRLFFNHPHFIAANLDRVREAISEGDRLVFTAHSIPNSMAAGSPYVAQLQETCRLVAEGVGVPDREWDLVYQSRSGRLQDPWLGPDIIDHLANLAERGVCRVLIHPIGFLSDHLEVLYDLDVEARQTCDRLGLEMSRAATVGTHPLFVRMLSELIQERVEGRPERRAIGSLPAAPDVCLATCCPPPSRPPRRASGD